MYEVESGGLGPKLLVFAGVAAHYAGTSIAIGALARAEVAAPGRRAIAQWLPLLATAMAAVLMRQPDMAVALVFGGSVACLSLVLGMSTYVSPLQEFPPSRRLWPLVLPAALFTLLAGFRGTLGWFHAALLLAMGAGFLPLWLDRSPSLSAVPTDAPATSSTSHSSAPGVLVALVLAAVAAWATAHGAIAVADQSRLLSPPLLGSAVLSPFLLLPALGNASMLCQQGRSGEAVTSLVGTVLLNLCVLLPLVVVGTYVMTHGPTPYPLIVWRVDAVVLLILAFALVPVAAGRWLPGRLESMLLVLVYAVYLVFETLSATRML
jgi:Ca2+/Na+ antiporter